MSRMNNCYFFCEPGKLIMHFSFYPKTDYLHLSNISYKQVSGN